MAAALLQRALDLRSVPCHVSSAGFLFDGRPASDLARKVVRERGLDLDAHRSRVVDAGIVAAADLVLTMERRHARELVLAYACEPRTHTLKSFAELVSVRQFGPGPGGSPAPAHGVAELIAATGAARPAAALLGDGQPDEVPDPHGRSARVHRRTADDLAVAADVIADAFASAQGQPA
jgi:protein-tyrosine phosphatase